MKGYKISDGTYRIRFGNPFKTGAVLLEGSPTAVTSDYFIFAENKGGLRIERTLDSDEVIFGLGQNTGGLNRRGRRFTSYNTDDFSHTEEKQSLYGAHPFLIFRNPGETGPFGLFIDYPGEIRYDLGFMHRSRLVIETDRMDVDVYLFQGSSEEEIVSEYLRLTGTSYLPPKWAFGYQQCRWSYPDAKEVDRVIAAMREKRIPCDAIYLDIDYMDGYRDFTIDSERFPDFKGWVESCRKKGVHLVPIIDAGVKIDPAYSVYKEGIEKGYFCCLEDGEAFTAAVWPGLCHFPDFLNPEVRRWWGDLYRSLLDQGIDGFWNDMNEPALFYTPERLRSVLKELSNLDGEDLPVEKFFPLQQLMGQLSNHRDDYKSFYHRPDKETRVNHDEVHNLYGAQMTRAAAEGFARHRPDQRVLMFSRSSYAGAHRYGGMWNGDNTSWWSHILLNLQMTTSLNLSGFLYSGADTGGFSGDADADLLIRWTQWSVFTPLLRNHSALGTRRQEPFAFEEETTRILRHILRFRYALLSYLYGEFLQAAESGRPLIKPLAFAYREDPECLGVEDQVLVGNSIMAAPVYTQNAMGRYVYLPEDMLLLKVRSEEDYCTEVLQEGRHYIPLALAEFPVFLRKNRILPLGEPMDYVGQVSPRVLTLICYADFHAVYRFQDDDGVSIPRKKICSALFTVDKIGGNYSVSVRVEEGELPFATVLFHIYDGGGQRTVKEISIKG